MTNTISREFGFCAAHRIEGHPKCGRLHGHNYKVTIIITGELDSNGMVLDFGVLDTAMKSRIDSLDHRYLISENNIANNDPYAAIALENGDGMSLPGLMYSTAECLASLICVWTHRTLMIDPNLVTVIVQETEKNKAAYSPRT